MSHLRGYCDHRGRSVRLRSCASPREFATAIRGLRQNEPGAIFVLTTEARHCIQTAVPRSCRVSNQATPSPSDWGVGDLPDRTGVDEG